MATYGYSIAIGGGLNTVSAVGTNFSAISVLFFGEGGDPTLAATRITPQRQHASSSGSGTTFLESWNTRSLGPDSLWQINPSTDTTSNQLVLGFNPVCSAQWRGDYRRNIYISGAAGSDDSWNPDGSTSIATQGHTICEHFLRQLTLRRFRRSRNAFFFHCDITNNLHKKTGSGAYELTSRPQPMNDGLTWLDRSAWQLGNSQSDFWQINLFGGPGGTLFTQSLTGTLSFVGAFGPTTTFKGLTGTLSFIGAIQRFTSYHLSATLSFVGAIAKNVLLRPFTATLSFVGALANRTGKALTGTLSFVGAIQRLTSYHLSATLSFVGALARFVSYHLTAALSFVGGITKFTSYHLTKAGFFRALTVSHGQVAAAQTDFPVLVSLSDPTLKSVGNGGHVSQTSGSDIRFYSDSLGTTLLKWEIERYDPVGGTLVAWVKIASLSSTADTVFYMFYGDPAATSDLSDAVNTWSNNFVGVYHLKDGTTLNVNSSTGANNGTNNGATAAAGTIDGGASFVSASSQYINVGNGINPNEITLSAWVNAPSFANAYNTVVCRAATGSNAFFRVKSNGKIQCGCVIGASTQLSYDGVGTNTLSSSTWYYLTFTYGVSPGLIMYVNASADHSAIAGGSNLNSATASTYIANDAVNTGVFWNGLLDEVRIATVARSATWITTEYNNQSNPATFMTMGVEGETGELSFAGTFNKTAVKRLAASLSFAGSLVRVVSYHLSAALSFIASLTRFVGYHLSAALSFVGLLTKFVSYHLTAALSFVGTLATNLIHGGQHLTQNFTAALSFSGALTRSTSYHLTAALSYAGAIQRQTAHNMTAALSYAGTLSRSISYHLSAALSFVGALTRVISKLLTAALLFSGALIRQVNKSLTAALSFVGAITRQIQKSLVAAALSFVGALSASKGGLHFVTLTASLSFVGNINTRTSYHLAAALSYVGALNNRISKTMTAALSFVGTMIRTRLKSFTAALSFVGTFIKQTQYHLSGALSYSGSLGRFVAYHLTAALSFVGALTKGLAHTFTAALSFVGALTRSHIFSQVFIAALSFSGALTKQAQHGMAASLSFAGILVRQISKSMPAQLLFSGALATGRMLHVFFTASLSFSGILTSSIIARVLGAIYQIFVKVPPPQAVTVPVTFAPTAGNVPVKIPSAQGYTVPTRLHG